LPSQPGITQAQGSTRTRLAGEPGRAAAKLLVTRSTRGDDMPAIEVGDLVKRIPPHLGPDNKVYLVAEIEKREHSDGRPILGPHGAPSWCILHDDEGRLTAVKSLTLVQKGSR